MNAKYEFIEFVKDKSKVKCVYILKNYEWWEDEPADTVILKINYNDFDYGKFLEELNYEYDNGFGGQNLFGTIWFEDETWAHRREYDGSERWEYNQLPEVPDECKQRATDGELKVGRFS